MNAPTPDRPPAALLWLRWGLWALLIMVLSGLGAVWWANRAEQPRRSSREPLEIYSQIPDFEFTRSTGETILRSEIDTPWVADFIFTRCAVTCPRMTSKMAALGPKLPPNVRRVSITVDPVHDSPKVLWDYAKPFRSATTDDDGSTDWLFLTGPVEPLRKLIKENFLLGVSDLNPDDPGYQEEPITHSTRFVLVDASGAVRGYYDAFDAESVANLLVDASSLP